MLPSFVFYYIESGWTYLDSLYFTILSLNTIAFGDFTSSLHGYEDYHGYELNAKLGEWVWTYRAFTVFWLVLGLSFFYMINIFILNNIRKLFEIFLRYDKSSSGMLNSMAGKTDVWNHKSGYPNRRKSV